jgi:hypothetical protein
MPCITLDANALAVLSGIAAIASAIAAIAAAVRGPRVARRNYVSAMREKRANDLRAAASDLFANFQSQRNQANQGTGGSLEKKLQLADELPSLTYRLTLLLDPNDKLQKELRELIPVLGKEVLTSGDNFLTLRNRALELARLISDEQYEKAEQGE